MAVPLTASAAKDDRRYVGKRDFAETQGKTLHVEGVQSRPFGLIMRSLVLGRERRCFEAIKVAGEPPKQRKYTRKGSGGEMWVNLQLLLLLVGLYTGPSRLWTTRKRCEIV